MLRSWLHCFLAAKSSRRFWIARFQLQFFRAFFVVSRKTWKGERLRCLLRILRIHNDVDLQRGYRRDPKNTDMRLPSEEIWCSPWISWNSWKKPTVMRKERMALKGSKITSSQTTVTSLAIKETPTRSCSNLAHLPTIICRTSGSYIIYVYIYIYTKIAKMQRETQKSLVQQQSIFGSLSRSNLPACVEVAHCRAQGSDKVSWARIPNQWDLEKTYAPGSFTSLCAEWPSHFQEGILVMDKPLLLGWWLSPIIRKHES